MEPEGFPEGPGNGPEVKVTVTKGQRILLTDFMRPAPDPRPPTEKEQRKQREQKQQQPSS